jgi:AraC family transcriptional regulator of adaptative response / DNA-3-methyladenine glycosylase II
MDLDPTRCYEAILSRDRRFDGRFFTGVVTTGIYCRPVCPVSPPKLRNMRFYACAAAAEAAGFRPCKRCRPETAPGTPAWAGSSAVVSRALRLISEGGLDDGDLEGFSARLGIGDRQLRRLFAQHLGASPSDVARARRVHFARAMLDETDLPIAEVALSAGFASIRQFNHALKQTFGEPPTVLRGRRAKRDRAAAGVVVRLPYRPPLAWQAMLDFLALRAVPGIEEVQDGFYRRTIDHDGASGILEVEHGRVDAARERSGSEGAQERSSADAAPPHRAPHLRMRIDLPQCRSLVGVVDRARRVFDLNADSQRIGEQLSKSRVLRPHVAALPGLRVPGCWSGFELSVRAVLGQQITVVGARTLAGRIVERFGEPLAQPRGSLTHIFPTPERLADADLAPIGLPKSRAATIRAIAAAVASGRLRFDAPLGLDEAVARLCELPGIGPWTANYIAMRALGEPDAFPESDLGLRAALGRDGEPASGDELREAAEAWRPWRSYATIYVWHCITTAAKNVGVKKKPATTRTATATRFAAASGHALVARKENGQ